ncbi:MAG: hypothetical protein CM15mV51_0010 [uncultured marine virus]|nr:MAG: hypothetical protein CM15mV51_0010 [uncultured marine virus]
MKSKIVVTADDQGNVIRQTKNPEWGQIRITQKEMTFVNNTGQERTLSALLLAKVEQLKNLNWVEGQTLVGNIIVKEQTEPLTLFLNLREQVKMDLIVLLKMVNSSTDRRSMTQVVH